jgi:uroporphyrinogen decarboxylase
MYQAAKKRGIIFVQHSCGNITEFLPDLIDAGLAGIQSLEPASGIRLGEIKEKYGDKITLLGGMDSSATLNFGTTQEIEKDVIKCINTAARNGGYFAGPAHNILDAPWNNVLAFRDSIEKYRKYPI